MPAKRKNHLHPCRFFEWKIFERNGHFYADGRAGSNPGNRHSLKATSYEEALQALQRLDLVMAAEHGLVKYEQVADQLRKPLSIEEGISRYLKERERDLFNGGIRHKTLNRYRPILRKFADYCLENGAKDWNQVDTDLVKDYQAHLFSQGFMQPTVGMETTLIKQTVKFFVRKNLLPAHSKIDIKVPKTKATGRHAFSIEEADAILEKARNLQDGDWMYRALLGLTFTGMRVNELVSLRWSDIDFENNQIHIRDEGFKSPLDQGARRTKSGQSRIVPIQDRLREELKKAEGRPVDLVFPNPNGKPLNTDWFRRQFEKSIITPLSARFASFHKGKGFETGRFHSFRHSFCARCFNAGIPEKVIMSWMGHTNSQIVHYYFALKNKEAQTFMQKLR